MPSSLRPTTLPEWLLRLRYDVADSGPLEYAVRSAVSRYAALLISELDKLVYSPAEGQPAKGSDAAFYSDRLQILGRQGSDQRNWLVKELVRVFGPGRPALEPVANEATVE